MPIYDYVCESCGHVMEVIHGRDAAGPAECPQCGGPMSKAFAAPAVHFKGSGWAKKDRKSVSGPVRPKTAPEGGASEGGTSDAKAETSPSVGPSAPADAAGSASKEE